MTDRNRIPVARLFSILSIAFLIGIFTGSFMNLDFFLIYPAILLVINSLLLVALINFFLKNKILTLTVWIVLFFSAGIFFFSYHSAISKTDWPFDQTIEVTGKIISKPVLDTDKQQMIIRVNKASASSRGNIRYHGLLLVGMPQFFDLKYGDQIKVTGIIEKPFVSEDFDYGKYLKKYPVYGLIKQTNQVEKMPSVLTLKDIIYRNLYSLSDSLIEVLNQNLPEPHASLAAGIILGQRANIPQDISDNLSKTGLSHIISLSGYNITIIVASLADLLLVYVGRRRIFLYGSLLVITFIIATGMAPSVVRAAIFALLIIFGKTMGKKGDKLNLSLTAALILVLYNPFMLRYDIGFQLSFLAFIGIMYFSPLVLSKLEQKDYWFSEYINPPLAETLGAQIMTLPVLLANFGTLSLIAPLANIAIIWILPYVMAAGFMTVFVGLIWEFLGRISSLFIWPSLEYIVIVTSILANLPLASISVDKSWLIELVGYVFIILFVANKEGYLKLYKTGLGQS